MPMQVTLSPSTIMVQIVAHQPMGDKALEIDLGIERKLRESIKEHKYGNEWLYDPQEA